MPSKLPTALVLLALSSISVQVATAQTGKAYLTGTVTDPKEARCRAFA